MRLITYQTDAGPRIAGRRDKDLIDLNAADPGIPSSMRGLLELGPAGLARARAALAEGQPLAAGNVKLLAPVHDPPKILCVGLNYQDHARESGAEIPSEPVVFNKLATALGGAGDPIVLPRISRQVDYEAELVVIIGTGGRYIPRDRAMEHVAGYTCGHDVSARDWQLGKPGGQWLLGKSFDSFGPVGPDLVTADEVADPHSLDIALRINGETMQQSNTRQLIFSIDYLIEYISSVCTLQSGDLLFTGTPPGVGAARKPPVFLKPQDEVIVQIEKIGQLANRVVAES